MNLIDPRHAVIGLGVFCVLTGGLGLAYATPDPWLAGGTVLGTLLMATGVGLMLHGLMFPSSE